MRGKRKRARCLTASLAVRSFITTDDQLGQLSMQGLSIHREDMDVETPTAAAAPSSGAGATAPLSTEQRVNYALAHGLDLMHELLGRPDFSFPRRVCICMRM